MRRFFFIVFALLSSALNAQKIATFDVDISQATNDLVVPVKVLIDGITHLQTMELQLVHVAGNKATPVPFQISREGGRMIHWLADPTKGARQSFQLLKASASSAHAEIKAIRENGALTIQSGDKKLLRYQYEKMDAPSGVDPSYGRSGFIHPLWSPKGNVLTRVQPPDHYHHYGIWNPWTHVLFEGDTIDFWNLNQKQGLVRFANFAGIVDGPVFSEYRALQEHVVVKNDKVALNEIQTVRVYQPESRDYYIADIVIDMSCADKSPFKILAYRYAGLGWRTTEKWDRNNSEVLTSDGKTRKDADGSTARWCLVQGAIDSDYAGALMLSYPSNFNHPEPLRIWPENQYNRGDMFANFSPTKTKDWELLPGKIYSLQYRFIVFNGKFAKERAEGAWQNFAHPPKVTTKLH
jgi:hypothetical protein